jgi:hypothetical protein
LFRTSATPQAKEDTSGHLSWDVDFSALAATENEPDGAGGGAVEGTKKYKWETAADRAGDKNYF